MSAASYRKVRGRSRAPRLRACLPILCLALGCVTVPITGRQSVNIFQIHEDVVLGAQAFDQVLAEAPIVTSGPDYQMVNRAMDRLTAVADDPGFEWEVTLIDDPQTINAFALPGGKMAVYTGILPVCEDEEGLAVVMGHEIAHVVARHGTERMTQVYGAQAILVALDAGDYADLAQGALALALRPFGRQHESEADRIGQIYMARAGYDPSECIRFWERMNRATGGSPDSFFSTHPSHETRVRDLEKWLPEAEAEARRR